MNYKQVLKTLRDKIVESKSSEYSSEDLDFYESLQRMILSKSIHSHQKSLHNSLVETEKKRIIKSLDKLKI